MDMAIWNLLELLFTEEWTVIPGKFICLKLQIQITTIKWYYMDYIRGMQILPRVVRADENVITRKLQIFTEDAILMKCMRKKVSHWNVRFEPKDRNVVEFFMKTFPHFFWRNLFKHLRDSVFINDSNVFTLYFVIYFILPSVLLPAINTMFSDSICLYKALYTYSRRIALTINASHHDFQHSCCELFIFLILYIFM